MSDKFVSGEAAAPIVGWGTIPTKYGMPAVLSWPLLVLEYNDAGACLRVRPRWLARLLEGGGEVIEVPWAEMSRFQYSSDSAAWQGKSQQLIRFATYSPAIIGFVAAAMAHGVVVEPVESTWSRAWTLE